MYIYVYLAIICIHISLCSCPVPVVYRAFRFSTLPPRSRCRFSRCVFLFVPSFSPPATIPFVITEDESRVIGTRSFRVYYSPSPFPDPPIPFYNWHCVPFLLPHFAFKVRLSLPNNIILSLDTSPCEGGRRHDRRLPRSSPTRQPSTRGISFFLSFLFLLLPFSACTAN